MRGLFNYDGPLTRFFGKMGDCVILSVLWLVFSLPVITLGASTTALYHSVHRILRQDYGGLWENFWDAFRSNFKQSTVIWLVLLAVFYILGMSAYSAYLLLEAGQSSVIPLILLAVVIALALMWALYLFPCVARFKSTTARILKSCAAVAAINLLWSVALLAVFAASVYLTVVMPVGLLVMPGAGMYASSLILEHIFPKYIEQE